MYPGAPAPLLAFFVALPLALAGLAVAAQAAAGRRLGEPAARTRRWAAGTALAAAAWLAFSFGIGASGLLLDFASAPPPLAVVLALTLSAAAAAACSPWGARLAAGLPLAALVGFQAFRLPLELAMHAAADARVMPEVMSYSGYNFDIVTGATAIPVAWALWRRPAARGLALAWNLLGSTLLLVIMAVSVAASPIFSAFGADQLNTWVAHAPFSTLPLVMVAAALAGHILLFRRLLAPAAAPALSAAAAK